MKSPTLVSTLRYCKDNCFGEAMTHEELWNTAYNLGRARWYWGPRMDQPLGSLLKPWARSSEGIVWRIKTWFRCHIMRHHYYVIDTTESRCIFCKETVLNSVYHDTPESGPTGPVEFFDYPAVIGMTGYPSNCGPTGSTMADGQTGTSYACITCGTPIPTNEWPVISCERCLSERCLSERCL